MEQIHDIRDGRNVSDVSMQNSEKKHSPNSETRNIRRYMPRLQESGKLKKRESKQNELKLRFSWQYGPLVLICVVDTGARSAEKKYESRKVGASPITCPKDGIPNTVSMTKISHWSALLNVIAKMTNGILVVIENLYKL